MSDISKGRDLEIIAATNPFTSERITHVVGAGKTIAEIIDEVNPDPILAQHMHIYVGDHYIPPANWSHVRPHAGTQLTVRAFIPPMGGDSGGGKDLLRTILIIAVLAAALAFGPALGGVLGLTGALAGSVGQAIIGIGGMLLINTLIPARGTSSGSTSGNGDESASATKYIESARNRANQFGPVPVLFGRRRIIPLYAVNPKTRIEGDDQYLVMMLVWSVGPIALELGTLKIGETLVANFDDLKLQHREGYSTDTPVSAYPQIVEQQNFQIVMKWADDFFVRTTSDDADEINVDIVFPEGLITVNDDGTRTTATVKIQIQYRTAGVGVWQNIPVANGTRSFPDTWANIDEVTIGEFNRVTFTQQKTTAIRHSIMWQPPVRGKYDVRIKRVTIDATLETVRDLVYWTALRRITNEFPIQSPVPIAYSTIKIRANDQLSGVIDQFSGVATMVAKDWTGSAWVTRATRNPAAAFRHALQGNATQTPKADSEIDLVALQTWSEFCVEHKFNFDQLRDFYSSTWDLLQDIAAAGRASPTMIDGKYSVVVDRTKQAVSLITPRNSQGFKSSKAFFDPPHAFRVQFNNQEQDWQNDEIRVYLDGHSEDDASIFETIDFPGVTDPKAIYKHARFMAACAIQRPESWQFQQDMERLVYRRGDVVNITHDVLLVGLSQGRIKSLVTSGSNITGFTSDEGLIMDAGTRYGVSIRTAVLSNVAVTAEINTVDGVNYSVTFVNSIPLSSDVEVGNLFSFGVLGSENDKALITQIEPSKDFNATITAVPYRTLVYEYLTDDDVPPFNSKVTPVAGVPAVVIQNIRSDETVLTVGAGNSLDVHIAVKVEGLDALDGVLEVQTRPSTTGERWSAARIDYNVNNEVYIGDVRTGEYVDIRLRWTVAGRVVSGPWAYQYNHRVVGKSSPPAALQGLTISTFGGQAFMRWDKPTELDVQFGGTVLFRHSEDPTPIWGNSVSIGNVAQANSQIATLPLKAGTYIARVYDSSGIASDVVLINTKQASVLEYSLVSEIFESPAFDGEKTDVVVSNNGGANSLFIDTSGFFDDIPDIDAFPDFVDFYGGVKPAGTYQFASKFDFGSVTRVRLTSVLVSFNASVQDQFDNWTAPIDERADWDGTSTAQCDCVIYVALTDDDPNGPAPDWGDWARLDASEVEARGAKFKAELTSLNKDFNLFVTTLGVRAQAVV